MTNIANTQADNFKSLKSALEGTNLKNKFKDVLGAKAPQFITSITSCVGSNNLLQKCDYKTIVSSAVVAATLDLPINPNLGFAYIIPYYNNRTKQHEAQFQIGYKGFIQLAQRSGKFKKINVTVVKEGEIKTKDFLTGEFEFEWIQDSKERLETLAIGYVAYFELLNGFSKSFFMSVDEIKQHASKHSQSYKHGKGVWHDHFDTMASKTVLKMLLSKYAPMSTAMEKAIVTDQSVVQDLEGEEVTYVDNYNIQDAEIIEDVPALIESAESKEALFTIWNDLSEVDQEAYTKVFTDKLKSFE